MSVSAPLPQQNREIPSDSERPNENNSIEVHTDFKLDDSIKTCISIVSKDHYNQ